MRCPICLRQFANELCLLNHKKEKHIANILTVCNICGIVVKKHSMRAHMMIHEQKVKFECLLCKKSYKNKSVFLRHMHKHDENHKHICSTCGKGFYRKDHLKSLLKTHCKYINHFENIWIINGITNILISRTTNKRKQEGEPNMANKKFKEIEFTTTSDLQTKFKLGDKSV